MGERESERELERLIIIFLFSGRQKLGGRNNEGLTHHFAWLLSGV